MQGVQAVSAVETAKFVRASLKRKFAGTKFSVRVIKYSMSHSISVAWTDGPTQNEVETLLAQFEGTHFDPTCDAHDPVLTDYVDADGNLERIHYEVDSLLLFRTESASRST